MDTPGSGSGSATGGVGAAAGFHFQYLATVDTLLDTLLADDSEFYLVTEDDRDQAIDFSISRQGRLVLSAQAKSSIDGQAADPFTLHETLSVLKRLLATEAEQYLLVTNRPVQQEVITFLQRSHRQLPTDGLALAEAAVYRSLTQDSRSRMSRVEVRSTSDDPDLAGTVATKIRQLRTRHLKGIGAASAEILLGYLIERVLDLSGRRFQRSLTRSAALELFGVADQTLAQALGRYDWGRIRGTAPVQDLVPRARELDIILGLLAQEASVPRRIALTGLSGIGKTSLAAAICSLVSNRYDRVLWLTATDELSLRGAVAGALGLDSSLPTATIADTFRASIAASPDSWLIVLDSVETPTTLQSWLPAQGHGAIIATSTNALGWDAWEVVAVGQMTRPEAVELVQLRFRSTTFSEADLQAATALVERVDRWPLAIELACAFLVESGRGLAGVQEYLDQVTELSLDRADLLPPSYRSSTTLLGIVLRSFDLATTKVSEDAPLLPVELLSVLSFLPSRQAPVDLAGVVGEWARVERKTEHSLRFPPRSDLKIAIGQAVRALRSASIVHTHPGRHLGPTVTTNQVVLDVARELTSDVTQTLTALTELVDTLLVGFLEEENFNPANDIAAIGSFLVPEIFSRGRFDFPALFLLGNLAMLWQINGDHDRAIRAWKLELDLLGETPASLLRAKIHGQRATSMINNGGSATEVHHEMSRLIGLVPTLLLADTAEQKADVDVVVIQAKSVLGFLVKARQAHIVRDATQWLNELDAHFPHLAPAPHGDIFSALGTPGNDDARTLAELDALLATDLTRLARVETLFLRADCLTEMRRTADATLQFRQAWETAQEFGLQVAGGLISILNAWRHVAIRIATAKSSLAVARDLVRVVESIVGDFEPSATIDRAQLAALRAVTRAEREPMVTARTAVEDAERYDLVPTLTSPNVELTVRLRSAAGAIVDLRQRFGGARLVTCDAWRRNREGLELRVDASTDWVHQGAKSTPAEGLWVTTERGVGLLLPAHHLLIWAMFDTSAWLTEAEDTDNDQARDLERTVALASPIERVAIYASDGVDPVLRVVSRR